MTAYETDVLSDSPKGYWKLGDTSGSTAVDSSGNAHDGTYGSGITINQGGGVNSPDKCVLVHQTTNDYIQVADHADFKPTTAISVEVWVCLVSSNGNMRIAQKGSSDNGLRIYYDGTNLRGKVRIGGTDRECINAATLTDGIWHHIVLTWASGNPVKTYLDGSNLGATSNITGTLDTNTDALQWGNKAGSGGTASDRWNGYMDEAAFYATELSAARISSHYGNRSIDESGLRATDMSAEPAVAKEFTNLVVTDMSAEPAVARPDTGLRVTSMVAEVAVAVDIAYWEN